MNELLNREKEEENGEYHMHLVRRETSTGILTLRARLFSYILSTVDFTFFSLRRRTSIRTSVICVMKLSYIAVFLSFTTTLSYFNGFVVDSALPRHIPLSSSFHRQFASKRSEPHLCKTCVLFIPCNCRFAYSMPCTPHGSVSAN